MISQTYHLASGKYFFQELYRLLFQRASICSKIKSTGNWWIAADERTF